MLHEAPVFRKRSNHFCSWQSRCQANVSSLAVLTKRKSQLEAGVELCWWQLPHRHPPPPFITTPGLSEARWALGGSSHTSGLSVTAYLHKIKRTQKVLACVDPFFLFFIRYGGGCGYTVVTHQVIFLLKSYHLFPLFGNCQHLKAKMRSLQHMWRFSSRDVKWICSFMLQVHFPTQIRLLPRRRTVHE